MIFLSESDMYFQRCRLKFLLPYGPMLTKTKKKNKYRKKIKIWKKSLSRYGAQQGCTGSLSQNLALSRLTVLRKQISRTDGRRTDDGRLREDSSSAVQ